MDSPVHPDDLRVSDAERAAAQERLRRAVGSGQLDLREFDERVAAVCAARTRGDLARHTRDLPESPPAPAPPAPEPRRHVFADGPGGTAMRILTIIWLSVVAVNLVVWTLVSAGAEEAVHPWFVWLAPSGAVLGVLYAVGIGRPRR